jgi:arylsulfatase A-like enzyme
MKKVLFLLAVLVLASLGWYVRSSRIHSRNVVLIVVDALRADRLSCYGYDRQTSPNIDKIAQQGTLLEQAFSPLPMTQPAFTTIFTSLHPHSHGIKWNDNSALSDKAITIAEIFQQHGWQTSAVVGASNLDSVFG